MLVTQVEMLLSHPDAAQRSDMRHWLSVYDSKFLFDTHARMHYGFPALNVDWHRDDVRIDRTSPFGPFIDLGFTLRSYAYPHMLAFILRNAGWSVNGRYRTISVDHTTPWAQMSFSGRWTHDYEPRFPHGWSAGADRRRQEGRAR